jgi:NADPH:quinone reductase-like Zn-dependent oxidoreductase
MTSGAPARGSPGTGADRPAMQAVIQHRYGGPETLTVAETARPVAGERDVLIRVHAAGLNVADDVIMRGVPYFLRLFAGARRPRHGIRGVDVAGTVAAVGSQVTNLRPGDEVFGGTAGAFAGGGFAEYASVPRDKVVAKPPGLTFAQAAAVPVAAVTALRALRDAARVRPGQRVLVNGASGGVGTFAVQIAKALGADVTGVCSTGNAALVASIGADAVIDYTRDDFTRQPFRYDAVLDNVANRPLAACLHAVRPGGTLVPNANTPGRWFGGLGRIIKAQLIAPFVRQRIRTCHGTPNRPDLLTITELIGSGQLTP